MGDELKDVGRTEGNAKKGNAAHSAVRKSSYAATVIRGIEGREEVKSKLDHAACSAPTDTIGKQKQATQKEKHQQVWGIDSMASLHISGQRNLFHSFVQCEPVSVQMANGAIVTAEHRGSISLRVTTTGGKAIKITVDDVYYHEKFAANLLGWDVLRRKGWELHSTTNGTYIMTPGKKEIKLCTKDRVSVMESSTGVTSQVNGRVYGVREMNCSSADDVVRQHERLGHMGFDRLIHLLRSGLTQDIGKLNISVEELNVARRRIRECKSCALARGTRTAFGHRGLDRGNAPGETLHMDTFYVHSTNKDGTRLVEYGLSVMDPYTEWRWHCNLDRKDEVADAVIKIVRHAQTQFDCKVKRLYADGGTEFINQTIKAFCNREGIELRYPPARTQQLNGIAERAVRSGKEMTRAMWLHSGSPIRLWRYACLHMAYVWNRTHVARATGVTPYEAMYKKKPSAYHLGVFGCDAFSLIPKELRRSAVEAKMEPAIYLGHDATQNCARLLLLSKMKILLSRDVVYRERSFTHAEALAIGDERVQGILDVGYVEQPDGETISSTNSSSDVVQQNEARPQGRNGAIPAAGQELVEEKDEEYDVERIIGKRVRNGCTNIM